MTAATTTPSTARGMAPAWIVVVLAAALTGALSHGQPLVVLGAAGVLVGVLIAARPETASLLALGLIFSNATVIAVQDHHAPGAIALLIPVLLVVSLGYRVFALHEPMLMPKPTPWMVGLVIVQAVGALSSRNPVNSVASVQALLTEGVIMFVLITNAVRGWRLVRLGAIVIVIIAGLLGLASLLQEATGSNGQDLGGFAKMSKAVIDTEDGRGAQRHAGPIGEQNRWAQSLAITLPIAIALAIADRSRAVRLATRLAAVGIAGGVVMTYSRGAVVGLVLAVIVAVCLRWIRASTAAIGAAVAVAALLTFAPVFASRASTVVAAGSSVSASANSTAPVDGSFANRSTEAVAAISVYLRHPLFGVGVGLFPSYFQDEARAQGADRIVGVNREAHSLYLGLAAETGTAGLIMFFGFCGSLLASLGRARRRHLAERSDVSALATGFALSVIIYLTTGFFLHLAYIRYFWLFAALAAAMGMVDATLPGPSPNHQVTTTRRHHVACTESTTHIEPSAHGDDRHPRPAPRGHRLPAGPAGAAPRPRGGDDPGRG